MIVMTTPENQTGIQECVSANKVAVVVPLPGIFGVSPMEFNGSIMVNHRLAPGQLPQCLYNIAVIRSECW